MGVVLLQPHDCLSYHRDNLISPHMKSRRPRKLDPNYTISSSETPVSNPRSTRSEARKRSPPKGAQKNRRTSTELVADPPAAAAAKSLVMGQVKILKRGETLNESSTVAEDVNDRKASHGTASTPPRNPACDRKVSKDCNGGRKVSATKKKKSEKKKKGISISNPNPNPNDKVMKSEDVALSTTDRLGPDPEMVPKQTKNIPELFFAGSGFVESPPPSSVPVPLFFRKNVLAAVKDDPAADILRMLRLNLS